jgi:hypothetical protein
MKTVSVLVLTAIGVVSCKLDKLLHAPAPLSTPARLAFSGPPKDARAGELISPPVQVAVHDSAGRVTGVATWITLALGANPRAAKLRGRTRLRSVDGVATFSDIRFDKVGSGYTLTATAPGLPADTSAAFAVTPGPATRLGFSVQPSNAPADSAIKPPVRVAASDSLGNRASDYVGQLEVALGKDGSTSRNARLTGKTLASAAGGVATFSNLRIDRAGTAYTLTAAFAPGAVGGALVESAPFDITEPPPTATRLEVITQPQGPYLHAEPFQVQVAAVDNASHIISSFTGLVSIAIANDGSLTNKARLGGATQAVVVNGIATFSDLSIDLPGVGYTLRAHTHDLTDVTTEAFNVL